MRLLAFLLLLFVSPVFAFPSLLSLDGFLTNSSGTALNGSFSFVFSLYNVSSGGTALWTETQTLSVSSGRLNALLGSVSALSLPFDQDYYLGVKVSTDSEMSPRYRIASGAYSYRSRAADSIPSSSVPPVPCDPGHEGSVFYNSSSGSFMGCSTGGAWVVLGGSIGGQEAPGLSCKQIHDVAYSAPSGIYWLNPGGTSFQAYCDMAGDGGGWTRVGYFPNNLTDVPAFTTAPTEASSPTTPGFNKAFSTVSGTQIRMANKIGSMAAGTLKAAVSSASWQGTVLDTPQAQAYDPGANTESCHLGVAYSLSASNGDYYYWNSCCWGRGDGDSGGATNMDNCGYGHFSDHIWVR